MGPGLTKVLTAWNDVKYIDFIVIKQNVWPKKERKKSRSESKSPRKRRRGCVGGLSRLLDCPLVNLAWADKLESPSASQHVLPPELDRWIPPAVMYFIENVTETCKQLLVCLDIVLFAVGSAFGSGHKKLFEPEYRRSKSRN